MDKDGTNVATAAKNTITFFLVRPKQDMKAGERASAVSSHEYIKMQRGEGGREGGREEGRIYEVADGRAGAW